MEEYLVQPTEADVQKFLMNFSPTVQTIAIKLRDMVRELAPDALEQIDYPASLLGYGFSKAYKDIICVIILQKTYVNLGFPRGVDLPDPEGMLEGTGIRARHVKVRSIEETESPTVLALVQAAVSQLKNTGR